MIEAKLKPCPICDEMPRIATLAGNKYVMCPQGHFETAGCETAAEAIALWNAGKFEETRRRAEQDEQTPGQWPAQ